MANGIIQDKMARPEGDDISTETVRSNIKMPPELQNAYDRVVVAGMKIMFSKESHRLMLKELQGKGSISDKLGKGIAGLMLILFKESNETMPPQVIIPAGVALLMQAVDFVRKTKIDTITNADVGNAIETMISVVLQKFGASTEQIMNMTNQYSNENIPSAKQFTGA